MAFEDEQNIFNEFVKKMGFKQSEQRRDILLDLEIEKLQDKLTVKHGFTISSPKLEIYGI
jgi:hypothetical protein